MPFDMVAETNSSRRIIDAATQSRDSRVKTITPGRPFRATKIWNQTVKMFQEDMKTKKHWKRMKSYSNCFFARDAVDVLQRILQNNHNILKEVTRQRTIMLLQKFLDAHLIEDVRGRWEHVNFKDDKRLYRFNSNIADNGLAQGLEKPVTQMDETSIRIDQKENKCRLKEEKKTSRTTMLSTFLRLICFNGADNSIFTERQYSLKGTSTKEDSEEESLIVRDEEKNDIWRKVLISNIKQTLNIDSLDDLLTPQYIKGEWIEHNVTKIGKSGVVHAPPGQDLPHRVTMAMQSLANWSLQIKEDLACCKGFEKNLLQVIAEYYSCAPEPYMSKKSKVDCDGIALPINCGRNGSTKSSLTSKEPLLTFALYEIFTSILCLFHHQTKEVAVEGLALCLLLLPPANRRKLHLLLQMMVKVSSNPCLTELHPSMSTKHFILHTFSRYILSYYEEANLSDLLATSLVSFFMDHHETIFKVPINISKEVKEKIDELQQSKRISSHLHGKKDDVVARLQSRKRFGTLFKPFRSKDKSTLHETHAKAAKSCPDISMNISLTVASRESQKSVRSIFKNFKRS